MGVTDFQVRAIFLSLDTQDGRSASPWFLSPESGIKGWCFRGNQGAITRRRLNRQWDVHGALQIRRCQITHRVFSHFRSFHRFSPKIHWLPRPCCSYWGYSSEEQTLPLRNFHSRWERQPLHMEPNQPKMQVLVYSVKDGKSGNLTGSDQCWWWIKIREGILRRWRSWVKSGIEESALKRSRETVPSKAIIGYRGPEVCTNVVRWRTERTAWWESYEQEKKHSREVGWGQIMQTGGQGELPQHKATAWFQAGE